MKPLRINLNLLFLRKTLLFLVILFLPTQLGQHFWPQFSFIYSLKIDYLAPVLYFWDLLVILVISIWILDKPKINNFALTTLLFFLLTQALSLLTASNPAAGFVRLEQLLIISSFGLYLASQKIDQTNSILVSSLSLGILAEGSLSLLQFISGSSLGLWLLGERNFSLSTPSIATFNWFGEIFLRPYGTLPHPNVLAAFMTISLAIIFLLKASQKNLLLDLSISIGVLTTILTFSRGAILVLVFELLLFLKKRIKLLFLVFLLSLPFVYIRFSSALNFDSLSILRREELAEIAILQFQSSPLFGVGLNNFINNVGISNLVSGPSRFLQPVHNIFLLSLAETGIIGFFGLLIFLIIPIFRLWQKRNKSYQKGLLFVWITIIFLGMFDHYFLTLPQGQRLLFLVWGLSMLEYSSAKS